MTRIHLVLYGGVQGVGFRFFAERAARTAGVAAGWIRNRADGAVELEAEAEAAELARFRDVVTRGPAFAHVDRVEEREPSAQALPRPFTIVH